MLQTSRQYNTHAEQGVVLGVTEDTPETPPEGIWFVGEGSLVTIAPPGAGKGQAQIIPNLLTYKGPTIVLDIKRENFDLTHKWRSENVGPVYKFAPFDADSHNYNPLDFIDHRDKTTLWENARLTASMLTYQAYQHDFWEARAQDFLAAAIALVKSHRPAREQNMQAVLDMLYPTKSELDQTIDAMQKSPVKALRRTGNILKMMPNKQREGVFDAARRHVEVWQSERIEKITCKTNWLPKDFWQPPWRTLYICVPVGQVRGFASVLRVLIGQHIKGLIDHAPSAEQRRAGNIPPVLLLIDEMPQLGYMEPVATSVEVGRSYGLRTWMFAQSLGQIRKNYPDADGMVEMCMAQCFMNPEYDTARRLSDRLGFNDNVLRNKRQRVAEPQQLMGGQYADKILTFARGATPLKLNKRFAFQDQFLLNRMGVRP